MLSDSIRTAIAKHAVSEYPKECCGLVVNDVYRPCRNIAPRPTEDFELSPEDYADAEDAGPITALVHSHPGASARPSQADLTACEGAGIPTWVIASVGGQADGSVAVADWYEFNPTGYEAPLIGCEFSHGINDCYGLIRRYFKQVHGLILPDFPRTGEWWNDGHSDLYTQGFPSAGFIEQPAHTEPQTGDVLLMKIRSRNNVPNHAAVYLGGGWILHHCWGALSRRDQLARYLPHVTAVLRHKEAHTWKQLDPFASTAT